MNDIMIFNNIISYLGLVEIPLKGSSFTWSNMQENPLLEQLDWFFTTKEWTLCYPNTMVKALAKYISDHVPCVINIETHITKSSIFRFENFWVEHPGLMDIVNFYCLLESTM